MDAANCAGAALASGEVAAAAKRLQQGHAQRQRMQDEKKRALALAAEGPPPASGMLQVLREELWRIGLRGTSADATRLNAIRLLAELDGLLIHRSETRKMAGAEEADEAWAQSVERAMARTEKKKSESSPEKQKASLLATVVSGPADGRTRLAAVG